MSSGSKSIPKLHMFLPSRRVEVRLVARCKGSKTHCQTDTREGSFDVVRYPELKPVRYQMHELDVTLLPMGEEVQARTHLLPTLLLQICKYIHNFCLKGLGAMALDLPARSLWGAKLFCQTL